MTRLSQLTFRNYLIALHDALATAIALLASFYLRFEGDAFTDRLPLLLRILPYFVVLQHRRLLRLQPDDDEMALYFAPRRIKHPARRRGADDRAAGARLHLRRAEYRRQARRAQCRRRILLGKITIILYFFLEVFFLSGLRFAYRYFRYTRIRRTPRPRTRRRRC